MSVGVFLIVLALGAASIAAWVDTRYPRFEPSHFWQLFVHVVASMVIARIVVPSAFHVLDGGELQVLTAIFVIAFPILVYSFLVGFWLIKLAHRSVAGFGH